MIHFIDIFHPGTLARLNALEEEAMNVPIPDEDDDVFEDREQVSPLPLGISLAGRNSGYSITSSKGSL